MCPRSSMDRAFACGAKGCVFESRRGRHPPSPGLWEGKLSGGVAKWPYGAALEKRAGASPRGFESHLLRQPQYLLISFPHNYDRKGVTWPYYNQLKSSGLKTSEEPFFLSCALFVVKVNLASDFFLPAKILYLLFLLYPIIITF